MPLIQDFSQDFLSSLSGAYFQQTQQKALITEASGNLSMDTESNINLILCCLKLLELFTFYWKVCKKKKSVPWYDFILGMNTHHIYDMKPGTFEVYIWRVPGEIPSADWWRI